MELKSPPTGHARQLPATHAIGLAPCCDRRQEVKEVKDYALARI
jgi:hypothetical protein